MKKVLFTVIGIVAAIGMMGSAFAYFTDVVTTTNNTFQAGTLEMNLNGNTADSIGAVFSSPAGLAPGQEWTTNAVTFTNTGSIGIPYIFGTFTNTNNESNIADQIVLVSYGEYSSTPGWQAASDETLVNGYWVESLDPNTSGGSTNANEYLAFWNLSQDGSISLADLQAGTPAGSSIKTGMWFFDNGSPTNLALPVGGTAQLIFTFELLPSANNTYQGKSVTFTVNFVGAQTTTNLDISITENIP